MNNRKKVSILLVSSVALSSGLIQTPVMAYSSQTEHVGDIINHSPEMMVSGEGINPRKIVDKDNIQKITDLYRKAEKIELDSSKILDSYDLYLNFANNVTIGFRTKDLNGEYLGYCTMGEQIVPFKTKENIAAKILEIVKDTNKFTEYYEDGQSIREGDSVARSVEISRATYSSADNVIISGQDGIADSLASAPLSSFLKAPVLVTEKDSLRGELEAEINRLGAKNIYFTSGDNVISSNVKDKLRKNGYNITDLSSRNRYETSEKIAEYLVSKDGSGEKTILINGKNYADAPSISAFSYEQRAPILLTNGKILRKETFDIIKKNQNLLIVGGYNSIPEAMQNKLSDNYIKNARLDGKNRYETSRNIVSGLFTDTDRLLIADGNKDLAAGILSAGYCVENDRPLLLVKKGDKNNDALKDKNKMYLSFKSYENLQ
ncbi:MAG: cell wall-binding repeat-containing protein [Peptostreptococcus sp.]|uniref:cell wall-binding repeat-containing protein n=1 Tax=Peptostreptococcus sp. TaxID=1262 RepID=UPI002FC746BB